MKNDVKLSKAIHPPLNPLPSREGRFVLPPLHCWEFMFKLNNQPDLFKWGDLFYLLSIVGRVPSPLEGEG
jgi:hypothetical protein